MTKGQMYTIAGIAFVAVVSSVWAYYKFSGQPSDSEPDKADDNMGEADDNTVEGKE